MHANVRYWKTLRPLAITIKLLIDRNRIVSDKVDILKSSGEWNMSRRRITRIGTKKVLTFFESKCCRSVEQNKGRKIETDGRRQVKNEQSDSRCWETQKQERLHETVETSQQRGERLLLKDWLLLLSSIIASCIAHPHPILDANTPINSGSSPATFPIHFSFYYWSFCSESCLTCTICPK